MNEDQINELINATGALAEAASVFYNRIIELVPSEEVAVSLTRSYMSLFMPQKGGI